MRGSVQPRRFYPWKEARVLNSRNVILFTATIALLSILGSVISLSLPPDGGGRRADSYGTRRHGHRGLFELLQSLHIPVERGLAPPSAVARGDSTLVIWAPLETMVQYEPDHLTRVSEWVKNGGRVIIARDSNLKNLFELAMPTPPPRPTQLNGKEVNPIEAVGLSDVQLTQYDLVDKSVERAARMQEIKKNPVWEIPPAIARPEGTLLMKSEGSLAALFPKALTLFTPYEDIQVIEPSTERVPAGRIFHTQADGTERTFVAEYELGKGRVIVVSEPALFENYFMQNNDNPILAARLFHAQDRAVIFDEFYHGLTVRGNPFWLLTKHPFGMLFGVSMVAVAVFILRQAVHLGPALDERPPSRRTLAEYIGAMSNLFHRTGHFKFVMKEIRDGTLWHVRRKLGLSPQQEDAARIIAVLARKHPEDAERLKNALHEADEILNGNRPATGVMVLQAGRKLSECL